MTHCLLFALGAFALLSMARAAFWRHRAFAHAGFGGGHGGGGCGGGWNGGGRGRCGRGGWGHWGGRGGGLAGEQVARAAGEVLKRRLDVDDEQEPIVDHALNDLHASLKELKAEFSSTHGPLAEALRGDKLDDGALAAIFARHDDALARARREVVSAVKQVHAVLDTDQRKKAADWLSQLDPGAKS